MRWTTGDRLMFPRFWMPKCLGAQGKSEGSGVSLFECDEKSELQKWECKNETVLALKDQELYIELTADNKAVLSRTIGLNSHLTISGTTQGACTRTYRGTQRKDIESDLALLFCILIIFKIGCLFLHWKSHCWLMFELFLCVFLELYTIEGNAKGAVCMFPFFYNNIWYDTCTRIDSPDLRTWCATETNNEENHLWGFCPSTGLYCFEL